MINKLKVLVATLALSISMQSYPVVAQDGGLTVTSKDFKEGETLSIEHVYKGFGCEGGNLSPQLSWSGAPKDTKSYIITAYDPDAPTGSGWWHWTVVNIPASLTSLNEGISKTDAMPKGAVEGRTDYGSNGFGGACPPEGAKAHRYIVTVYAMPEAKYDSDENASGALVGFYANGNALAKGQIAAKYGR